MGAIEIIRPDTYQPTADRRVKRNRRRVACGWDRTLYATRDRGNVRKDERKPERLPLTNCERNRRMRKAPP